VSTFLRMAKTICRLKGRRKRVVSLAEVTTDLSVGIYFCRSGRSQSPIRNRLSLWICRSVYKSILFHKILIVLNGDSHRFELFRQPIAKMLSRVCFGYDRYNAFGGSSHSGRTILPKSSYSGSETWANSIRSLLRPRNRKKRLILGANI
jgi:hypothetical protein